MELADILQQLGLTQEDKDAARRRAIGTFGFGLLGARKGREGEALGRAGLLGMNARDQALADAQQGKMRDFQIQQYAAKMAEQEEAKKQAAAMQGELSSVFSQQPPTGQGGPTPQNLQTVQAARPSPVEQYRTAAAMYAARGRVEEAAKLSAIADKMEEEFSVDPKVGIGPDGQPGYSVFGKKGTRKTVEGFTPPPDNQVVPLGDRAQVIDRLRSGGLTLPYGQSPDSKASVGATLRGQDLVNARARDANAIASAGNVGKAADELRKEFNALPTVKAYGEVQPVLHSAREAMKDDTAAADLNLIYAAAKIFDPTSVVRESETNMVVQSGSPAQRFLGQFNYVAGGGRLTPVARAQLLTQIESRARGYESGYKTARKTYEGVAKTRNLPSDQIFVEPFASGEASGEASGAGLSPAEQAELDRLRKMLGRR